MNNLFYEFIRVALGTRDVLSREPSTAEWGELYREAQRQCVVALLVDGLERLAAEQRPPQQLLMQWIGQMQIVEANYALQCNRAKVLTALFAEKGYRSCVLKGVGFAQLYDNPARRQCGDIDLWVDGDRKEIMAWLKGQYSIEHVLWHHVDPAIFDDVHTEIHFYPGWMYNPFLNRRLQRWFESQKEAQMAKIDSELGFVHSSARFNAVYSLVHTYHHLIEEGVGLRHIIDYYYIVQSLPDIERSAVVADLKRLGLLRLASAMMWVLEEVCGMGQELLLCNPDEKDGVFLLDEVMRGGNFGHHRMDNRRRNTAGRMFALLPHYPREVMWIVPWKLWHKCWRFLHS